MGLRAELVERLERTVARRRALEPAGCQAKAAARDRARPCPREAAGWELREMRRRWAARVPRPPSSHLTSRPAAARARSDRCALFQRAMRSRLSGSSRLPPFAFA